MYGAILLLAVVLDGSSGARECANPPSRVSDTYWTFIDACGCSALQAPSRASNDYDRFMKACSAWRERNPRVNVVVAGKTTTTGTLASKPAECGSAPSRASDSYWGHLESCGCTDVDAPPTGSPDYERFLKTCSGWRERNPEVNVVVPESEPQAPAETSERKPER